MINLIIGIIIGIIINIIFRKVIKYIGVNNVNSNNESVTDYISRTKLKTDKDFRSIYERKRDLLDRFGSQGSSGRTTSKEE